MVFTILFISQQAIAAPNLAAMQQSTVHVIAIFVNGSGGASGSGFLVGDGSYAVTNWHVVQGLTQGGQLVVVNSRRQKTLAQVVWYSAEKDLAILKLSGGSMGYPVSFATGSQVQMGETVYAMGYPLAPSPDANVTASQGVVSRVVTLDHGVSYYQLEAFVNHGSSGGPVFDSQGQVIGIMARGRRNQPVGFAIQCDELLPALSQAGINISTTPRGASAAQSQDSSPAPHSSVHTQSQPHTAQSPSAPVQPPPHTVPSSAVSTQPRSKVTPVLLGIFVLGSGVVIVMCVRRARREWHT